MVEQVASGLIPQEVLTEMLATSKPEVEGPPDWYMLIRASKYLGVPPWELLEQSAVWVRWAWAAERGENEAQAELQRRAERKRG